MSANEAPTQRKRLFWAVSLSLASTRKIAEGVERMRSRAAHGGKLRANWVPPENLHVTLKFLGWANADAVTAIRDVVAEGLRGRKGFEVSARGTGAFPNEQHARVLWVGLQDGAGELARLAADIDRWMEQLGFERESRPFSAHLTVARVKEGGSAAAELLAPWRDIDWGRSTIREVILFESQMKAHGSEYSELARVPLEGEPARTERQTREVRKAQDSEEPETNGGQST